LSFPPNPPYGSRAIAAPADVGSDPLPAQKAMAPLFTHFRENESDEFS
jgi:hypothetical protein